MSMIAKAQEPVHPKANPPAGPQAADKPARHATPTRPVKATLTDNTDTVVFHYNPELIKIGHQSDTTPMGQTMGTAKAEKPKKRPEKESGTTTVVNSGDVIVNAGEASISFSDIIFDGAKTPGECAKLLKWTYPIKDPKSTAKDPPMVMPILYFSWAKFASGLKFLDPEGRSALILAKVDISYIRFDSEGTVTRAKVNLTCKIPPSTLAGTNPTSGGPPARVGHLVTAGEDLPGIARARYGSPGYWRQLAQLNGIDDPLRVRPPPS